MGTALECTNFFKKIKNLLYLSKWLFWVDLFGYCDIIINRKFNKKGVPEMFKICVLGCGGMSTGGHGPSFKKYFEEYKDVELSACCDLDEEKAKTYQEKFGFQRVYTDYVKMLDTEKPDVVSLVCPVQFTKDLAISIIKKGYNIILEKPPGLNKEEVYEIIKTANEHKDVFVRTSFNRRYTPLIMKLKEFLSGKKIFNVTYQMYRNKRSDVDFATTAIHAIDATKYIAGADYKNINIRYQELKDIGDTVSNFYLDCEFENGAFGQVALVPMGGVVAERVTVNTLDETYLLELPFWRNPDVPGRLRVIKDKEVIHDISGLDLSDSDEMFEVSGFYNENRLFFELIRSGAEPTCDLESGVQSVEIADCLRQRKEKYIK